MTARTTATRLACLLMLAGASMGTARPAGAHRHHRHHEHTVYGNVGGYQTVIDPHGSKYQSDDAFCQTDATMAATPTGSAAPAGGSQRVRMKHAYAACMQSRGTWQRIGTGAGGGGAAVSPGAAPPS
ncbi:hypothetical protein [Gluconacetobacter tumulisoli]|uniref:Uncharacterized protein n=1 Tax=Gluconacetobacter tumulisoli TaxID=1286189 RepID=A0A7W4PJK8_9PROT|nr:hypothetical protein [Gluconacetobacter tumulisoli]MBB2200005.1 hypothetical protein [Gluconacetobacter tumulisoli]